MSRLVGKVKWMDAKKGYGLINSSEVEGDVFFHYSELNIKGYKYLPPDSKVEFTLQFNASGPGNGKKALNIQHLT